ncbi:unnamed protein product, partial [Aphanomyces euteiches]
TKLDAYYAEHGTSHLEQLVRHLPTMKENLICAAVSTNDVALLQHLHAKFDLLYCARKLLNVAAFSGCLDTLIYLYDLKHPGCTAFAMDAAAKAGHLKIVKFLHLHRNEGCTTKAMDGAAKYGHVEVLKWLHANRTEGCTTLAMNNAAMNGHLQVVQWLHHNGHGCTEQAMQSAIRFGHLSVVQWLHIHRAEGCDATTSLDSSMSSENAKAMIEWLCVNRSDIDPAAFLKRAAVRDQIDVMELLLDCFQVPWSSMLTFKSVRRGQFQALRWIHSKYPAVFDGMDPAALALPALKGNMDLLTWLQKVAHVEIPSDLLELAKRRSRQSSHAS